MVRLTFLKNIDVDIASIDVSEKSMIKIEKLLFTEAKINDDYSVQDVEELLAFLKSDWLNYKDVLTNPNIYDILTNGNTYNLKKHELKLNQVEEEQTSVFLEKHFAGNIKRYLETAIKENKWPVLQDVISRYKFLLTNEADYFLREILIKKLDDGYINMRIGKVPQTKAESSKHYLTQKKFYDFILSYDGLTFYNRVLDIGKQGFYSILQTEEKINYTFYKSVIKSTRSILNSEIKKRVPKKQLFLFLLLSYGYPIIIFLTKFVQLSDDRSFTDKFKNSIAGFVIFFITILTALLFYWDIKLGLLHCVSMFIISRIQKFDAFITDELKEKGEENIYNMKTWRFRKRAFHIILLFLVGLIITIPILLFYLVFKFLGAWVGILLIVGLFVLLIKLGSKKENKEESPDTSSQSPPQEE